MSASASIKEYYKFVYTFDYANFKLGEDWVNPPKAPAIYITNGEKITYGNFYHGENNLQELLAFAKTASMPIVSPFSQEWVQPIFGSNKPAMILF